MITLYSGTPGSGKSYHAVVLVCRMLGSGRHVIANFALKFNKKQIKKGWEDRFFYWPNEEITINNIISHALEHEYLIKGKESQALIIIDEAGGRFNCRDFKNSDRTEWIDFFSQHRKLGFDFVLVAQNDRMLDRQIRGLIESDIKHRKVNHFGPFWMLPFPCFVAIEWWYTAKQRVGSEFFMLNKKKANMYDSFKMFTGFKLSAELMLKIEAQRQGIEAKNSPSGYDVPITAIYSEEGAVQDGL